jgi:hypothetical protein
MQDRDSPYYQFDPSSVGWLHRRAQNGEQILNADLIRIIEADPKLLSDDTLRDHVLRALKKPLPAKKGRKRKFAKEVEQLYIVATYEYLLPRLKKRMKRERYGRRKIRGTSGPAELLYELIGKRHGMEPESVRNLISSLNSPRN